MQARRALSGVEALPRLHGHANVRADVCFICHGKLKGEDGSYCETLYDDGTTTFAAAICRACKTEEITNGSHLAKRRAAERTAKGGKASPEEE
jgi:hypothetical protein